MIRTSLTVLATEANMGFLCYLQSSNRINRKICVNKLLQSFIFLGQNFFLNEPKNFDLFILLRLSTYARCIKHVCNILFKTQTILDKIDPCDCGHNMNL